MKRFIALMLAVILVFAFSACGSKNNSSETLSSAPTKTEEFVKPENYTSVLQVTINPIFKLYLDENNIVLAVEPVNEDAKSFSDSIEFENISVEKVIENIVEQSNKNGFIKDNAAVNFEITEQKDGIDNNDILTKVISAANKKATELNVEIKTETKENDNTETSENSNNTEASKPETTDNNETVSQLTESKPTHTHSFSNATCTTPAKCSCGEINGTALGHKWQNATCKAPKTCSVCKATEGDKLNHTYDKEGICSLCNAKDPNFVYPKVSSMNGTWKSYHKDGNVLIELTHSFSATPYDGVRTYSAGEWAYMTKEDILSNGGSLSNDSIVWEGTTYYRMGGGFVMEGVFEESNDKIIVTDHYSNNKKMELQRTSTTSLEVVSFDSGIEHVKIPIGTLIKLY